MKSLTSIILISFLVSCGQTENDFEKLSDVEKENLRLRAQAQCLTDNDAAFKNYKKLSAQAMFTSDSYQRNANFRFKLVNDAAATTSEKEGTIQVWNRGSNFITFYMNYTKGGSKDFFFRLDKTQHDAMIDDLKDDFCTRGINATFQTGASISVDGPITVTYKYRTGVSDGKVSDFFDSYTYNFNEPIIFAGFHMKRRQLERPIDADGDIDENDSAATKVNFTSSLAAGALPDWQYDYSNDQRYAQKFCTYQSTSGQYRVSNNPADELGYPLPDTSSGTICPGPTLPSGWNMALTGLP